MPISFFQVNGEQLNTVNKYKYLGIIITKNGNFKVAKETLADKGEKVAYSIKNSLQSENFESIDAFKKAFDSIVKPVILYGQKFEKERFS